MISEIALNMTNKSQLSIKVQDSKKKNGIFLKPLKKHLYQREIVVTFINMKYQTFVIVNKQTNICLSPY